MLMCDRSSKRSCLNVLQKPFAEFQTGVPELKTIPNMATTGNVPACLHFPSPVSFLVIFENEEEQADRYHQAPYYLQGWLEKHGNWD